MMEKKYRYSIILITHQLDRDLEFKENCKRLLIKKKLVSNIKLLVLNKLEKILIQKAKRNQNHHFGKFLTGCLELRPSA